MKDYRGLMVCILCAIGLGVMGASFFVAIPDIAVVITLAVIVGLMVLALFIGHRIGEIMDALRSKKSTAKK